MDVNWYNSVQHQLKKNLDNTNKENSYSNQLNFLLVDFGQKMISTNT